MGNDPKITIDGQTVVVEDFEEYLRDQSIGTEEVLPMEQLFEELEDMDLWNESVFIPKHT